jgi:dimethylglycine dehydrogenase
MVNRITYTGDLGYELWMKPSFQRRVYLAIKEAGQGHGIVDFGMRALLSMRLEKNFPTWFAELRPIYGPFEGAMDRFVKLQKRDFIGREAAVAERDAGPRLRRVSLMIDATDADVLGDEPIWAKVATDHGTIDQPHGYGAPRFDATGRAMPRPDPVRDGDWRVVGWVTSGGYAHWVKASMAQGYLPADLSERGEEGLFAVEIMGERRAARIALEPPFDPAGERMRM